MPGTKTLAIFRTDMEAQLGNRGFGTTLIDQWVNSAYLELTGGIRFPELLDTFPVTTAASTPSYAGPTDSVGWESVIDDNNDKVLERLARHDFFRRDASVDGTADSWTREGDQLHLNPTPDAVITINILHVKQPTLLVAVGDKTAIPAHWDYPIELLAVSRGLLHAVEYDRSTRWRNLAINYIQSRLVEGDFVSGRFQPVGLYPQVQETLAGPGGG